MKITVFISGNEEKIKEIITEMLAKVGNQGIGIIKEDNIVKIADNSGAKDMVSLKDKIIELEESLYNEKKGILYRSIMDTIERYVIEYVLQRTDGNQLQAARVLGINRNTMRAKIKRLEIQPQRWKIGQ